MLEILKQIAAQLNTKTDWAIVGSAGLAGAGVDLFLVNIGVLSPGECAAGAAGIALTTKRGWEARRDAVRNGKILTVCMREAKNLSSELDGRGKKGAAMALRLATEVAEIDKDVVALKAAIVLATAQL